ncbi:MAG: glycoside hydrolase family 2 TIM barrel-domain containing protein [Saprospiraceae bacterium]|nr:glycoside hydrolase family 2 TIM barrel-domain containing protein [Saprospiraceae bacterium]
MIHNCFVNSILLFILLIASTPSNGQVTVEKSNAKWNILVDGQIFDIKGVTFGYDKEVDQYEYHFKELKFLGVNTIRLWGTNDNVEKLLDAAQAVGIKVMVGIWMRHGRPGMEDDDKFNYLEDNPGKDAMYQSAIETVEKLKHHPAVLTWGIGNEVYLNTATDEEKTAYSIFLEKVCSTIKKMDPNHPITSVEAWTFGLDWWEKYVPSIDIYGLNCYGYGANLLNEELNKKGIDKPYIVTEFGVTGEWDTQEDKNGIKQEPSDQEKYDAIANGYPNWIQNKPNCLGVYIFHYGMANEFVGPWLLTHHDDLIRPQYWAIRKAFTGKEAINTTPNVNVRELASTSFNSGDWAPIIVDANDEENDNLEVYFTYNHRYGSRKRRNQLVVLPHRGNLTDGFEVQMPKVHGAVKVYVNVKDDYGNIGMATTSTNVIDKEEEKRAFLVPKASLPFYITPENTDLPYVPTGYMGNYSAITVKVDYTGEAHSGESCVKIKYDAFDNWYGVAFVDPANDWGEILGGYDIRGATKFTFWAKASEKNIKATIGYGLIDKDKPFYDTAKQSKEIKLSKKWKKYTLKIKNKDLTCIRSGLVLFSSSQSSPHEIFLDDVVFE